MSCAFYISINVWVLYVIFKITERISPELLLCYFSLNKSPACSEPKQMLFLCSVTFQFENYEAVFPITIQQPHVPVLYDMGTGRSVLFIRGQKQSPYSFKCFLLFASCLSLHTIKNISYVEAESLSPSIIVIRSLSYTCGKKTKPKTKHSILSKLFFIPTRFHLKLFA